MLAALYSRIVCALLDRSLVGVVAPPIPPPGGVVVPFTPAEAAWNTTLSLTAGAFAGGISRSATAPLERLKVMKQVQSHSTKYNGILSALKRMVQEEGLRGLFKGNGTNVARIAPFSAIQFFSFDVYKGVSCKTSNNLHNTTHLRVSFPTIKQHQHDRQAVPGASVRCSGMIRVTRSSWRMLEWMDTERTKICIS